MLLVDAMILLIDSIIVVTGVLIVPLVLFGLFYNSILENYRIDDEE